VLDNNKLIAGYKNGLVRTYNSRTVELLVERQFSYLVEGYQFMGSKALCWDLSVDIWDMTGHKLQTLAGHGEKRVTMAEADPTLNWIVTGSLDKTVRVWDVETGML
jgi:WD40 repeat protein